MRLAAAIVLPILLTACATPREQCLSQVTQNLRINESLIRQTEANLARGFGVERRQQVREIDRVCRGVTESGEEVRTRCEDVIVRDVRVPVALDLRVEQAKLESLREQNVRLRAEAGAAQDRCVALYPE